MQLTLELVLASAPRSRIMGTKTPNVPVTRMREPKSSTVESAIGRIYDMDVSSRQAANNCFIILRNGYGRRGNCSEETQYNY